VGAADLALAVVRAIHFGAALLLFGQLVYVLAVSPGREPGPGFHRIASGCLAVAAVTALAWLVLEAPRMSGLPLAQALQSDTLATILMKTQFGKVAALRFVLLGALVLALHGVGLRSAGVVAGLLLLTIAASGHAVAEPGAAGVVHFVVDSAHLLAAGAWLGALVPFVLFLRRAPSKVAHQATVRFSSLGIACAAVLLFSGVLNASYTVSLPLSAALRSEYGRLLALKVLAFLAILLLAAANRTMLMPRLLPSGEEDMDSARARRWLVRNSLAEIFLGFGILAIVGMLGITAPVAHAAEPAPAHSHPSDAAQHGESRTGSYAPGLGEIMALQQMRHAKLWFAGAAGNWELADYELGELKEGFEDAARLHPIHEGVPVGEMMTKLTPEPLAAIGHAIHAQNAADFRKSFDALSATCNACHQAANHAFIRIGRPTAAPYGNQIFAPAKK
jgi:copper resistance protein D